MPRYNTILAGPIGQNVPQVRELPCAAAHLPGIFVSESSGEFAAATAGAQAKLYVLQDNYLAMKGVDDAYAADDTGLGLEMLDSQLFNVRVPTGVNVTQDAALTVGAGGKAALATAEDYVVAYAEEAYNNTSGADQLVRVRAAKGFLLPAA